MHFILAIDNDPNYCIELEYIFQGLRQRIVITKFSQTVKEYAKSSNPDIIIMGLSFKDKKELEFILELRKDVITRSIPILALIPKKDDNFIINHKILGFTEFMVKPIEKQVLLDKINSLIQTYKYSEANITKDAVSFVEVDRTNGRLLFLCRGNLLKHIYPEFKKIFTIIFLKSLRDEHICFDIRGVPDVSKEDVALFEKVTKIFSGKGKISIIAGRHLGAFIEHLVDDKEILVFMAPSEFDDYVNMEIPKEEPLPESDGKR